MKQFLVKTIQIILPVIIMAIITEPLLRHIPNDYTYKKEYLDKNARKIETLILGSSFTYFGLDPKYFTTNTFNAAQISQTLDISCKIFEKYKPYYKTLQTVIIPISYPTLFTQLKTSAESWRIKNYIIYYQIKIAAPITDQMEITANTPQYNIKRIYTYYIKRKTDITSTPLGWGTTNKSINACNLVETGKTAVKRNTVDNTTKQNQEIYKQNVETLQNLIAWCQSKNIQVILFTPPSFETYRKNCNPQQLNNTINTTTQIASKYTNCTYLNLFADTNFVAGDYYDADHLSEIGAKKLSIIINDEIIKIKQKKNKITR